MAKSKKPAAKKLEPARAAAQKPRSKAAKRPAPPKRGVQDLGGLPGGPIDRSNHTPTPFEERVDALMMVLTNQKGIYGVDSLRRTIEGFNKREYAHLAYYEKWMRGIRLMMVERGVLTDAEIEAKIAALRAEFARTATA